MTGILSRLDQWLHRRRGVIGVGPGRGLRFTAGPSNPAYENGTNELLVQAAVAAHLSDGGVLLDIGANVGFFSVIGARLVGPSGRVVAFEPVPANADLIRRNATANGFSQISVVAKAVTDRAGRGQLVLAEYAGGAALASVAPPPDACGEIEVDLVTIDGWLAGQPDLSPDLVKIDVEGAEAAVLHGMTATLGRRRPVVVVELDDSTAVAAEAKADECRAILEGHGYVVERLEDSYPEISWHVIHLLALPGRAGAGPD